LSSLLSHIALVSESATVPLSQVAIVSAAIQKQVTRDFSPIWGLDATVDPFETTQSAPHDAWFILIQDKIDNTGQSGYHLVGQKPLALVLADTNWPITCSHEALEMIADPFGSRTITGKAPSQAPPPLDGLGFVPYLVEVCDPCEDPTFGYPINDVAVSDFVTPDYYSAGSSTAGRFSFQGHVTAPHQVLEGGYVSFQNLINLHWLQLAVSNQQPSVRDFGFIKPSGRTPLRELADRAARRARKKSTSRSTPTAAFTPFKPSDAQLARAKALRESIAKFK
jgi:hypothetical protein